MLYNKTFNGKEGIMFIFNLMIFFVDIVVMLKTGFSTSTVGFEFLHDYDDALIYSVSDRDYFSKRISGCKRTKA